MRELSLAELKGQSQNSVLQCRAWEAVFTSRFQLGKGFTKLPSFIKVRENDTFLSERYSDRMAVYKGIGSYRHRVYRVMKSIVRKSKRNNVHVYYFTFFNKYLFLYSLLEFLALNIPKE